MLSGRQYQQQSFNDSYTGLILEEAENLYNRLTTELTSRATAAAASTMTSSLPSLDNMHKLTYKKNNTYQTEESRYNNNQQPEIYDNDKEQLNE
jgi:molecular chaperone GrpE (heat shock protein)